jgi:hypothetical protein
MRHRLAFLSVIAPALLLVSPYCSAQSSPITGNPEADKRTWLSEQVPPIFVKDYSSAICPVDPSQTSVTLVGGVLWPTLMQVDQFLKGYLTNPICITGGSELSQGHTCSDTNPFSHCNGFKVDLRIQNANTNADSLSNYIMNLGLTSPGPCRGSVLSSKPDGAPQYFSPSGMDFALEYPTVQPPFPSPCEPPIIQLVSGTGQHWDVLSSYRSLDVLETGLTIEVGQTGSVTPSAYDQQHGLITAAPWMFSYAILPALSNIATVDYNGIVTGISTTMMPGDAVLRVFQGPCPNFCSDIPIEVDLPPTPGGGAQCIEGAPVPSTGCWQWTPGAGGALGGWVWVPGSSSPSPPEGGGAPPPGQCDDNSALNVLQSGCWVWVPNGTGGAWIFIPPQGGGGTTTTWPVTPVSSYDPNDITGLPGIGTARYLTNSSPFTYLIQFENLATATAPAQQVTVTDALDSTAFDLSTVTLGPIAFPGQVVTPPAVPLVALGMFSTVVDLRPTTNLLVQVTASLNAQTGVLSWSMASLDPVTMQPPTDPLAGFLPPGSDGSVSLVANAKSSLASGTTVSDQASIVFDLNPAISTPVWSNTIDSTPPTSAVSALPPTEGSANFPVAWQGSDTGAGIQDFTIFASDNGGPFSAWLLNTTTNSATFFGQWGHTYAFYSIARDLVGNIEPAKTIAETTTQVISDPIPPTTTATLSPQPNAAGWNNSNVTVNLASIDNPGGPGVKQITYSAIGAQPIGSTTLPTSSTSFIVSTEGITTITFYATDSAGHQEIPKTLAVMLDKTPPTILCKASLNTQRARRGKAFTVTVSGTMTDATSGVDPSTPAYAATDEDGRVRQGGSITLGAGGSYSFEVSLYHERRRESDDDERGLTFVVTGKDRAGNAASCSARIIHHKVKDSDE